MKRLYSFVITGIGHALAPTLCDDEKMPIAEQFVIEKMNSNAGVTLLLEKDNHYDDTAIGVYLNCRRIGYVGSEFDDIRRFIDKEILEGVAFAVIDGRHSRHTLEAHLIDPDIEIFRMRMQKLITQKPYSDKLWISFTEDERARDAFFAETIGYPSDSLSNEDWVRTICDYSDRGFVNICREESFILNALHRRFGEHPEPDSYIDECFSILKEMNTKYHNSSVQASVLAEAYNKVKNTYGKEFVSQYEEWKFGESVFKHIDEARQVKLELKHWLLSFQCEIFNGYPWNWKKIASYIAANKYTRRDVYTFFEVMILVDWLTDVICYELQPDKNTDSIPEELSTEKALLYLKILRNAGYLDNGFKPAAHLTKRQIAIIAHCLAVRLKIRNKWKVFEGYWNGRLFSHYYSDKGNINTSESFEKKIFSLLK